MKKCLFGTLMLMMIMLLSACTPTIYGVPEDRWQTMSEQERVAAMEAYKARQEVLRQQRAERARLRAMEKQAQLEREAEEARRRQRQIAAIYRGEGLYGDLLRVNLEGGRLAFRGGYHPYQPVSFKIAANETKDIEIVSRSGRRAHMTVRYDGGNLVLDETPRSHRSTALRLPFENSWERGAIYRNRSANGPHGMRGVNVSIRIVGRPPHGNHGRRHPAAAVPPPNRDPRRSVPIVGKGPKHASKPVVVVVERHPGTMAGRNRPAVRPHGQAVEHPSQQKSKLGAPPARIKVVLRSGRVKVNRHSYPLQPQTIEMRAGQARTVVVRSRHGNLKVRLSYVSGELLLNDTPGHHRKGTRIAHAAGWQSGKRYHIKASEGRLLEDLDMLVVAE